MSSSVLNNPHRKKKAVAPRMYISTAECLDATGIAADLKATVTSMEVARTPDGAHRISPGVLIEFPHL
jgi:hypothetical protein